MKNIFLKQVTLPMVLRRDGLGGTLKILKELETSQFFSPERIRDLQRERLKSLLVHAYRNTDYYRGLFDEAGFDPTSSDCVEQLPRIPSLTKKIIRDNLKRLTARNFTPAQLHADETGGTSGVKMKFYRNNSCLPAKAAALYRFEKWTGWDFGDWMGIVWPAQQDYVGHWTWKARIKNRISRREVVYPAAIMDVESIRSYIAQLRKRRPSMIRAFSSPLYEVAKYMMENDIDPIPVRGIVTTGEPLFQHQREVIESMFSCSVLDSYRCRDVGPIAQQCSEQGGLHINVESLVVETIRPPAAMEVDEGAGELVVTDLLNYGMPMIRYSMGDYGILSEAGCPCGRGLPLLKKVCGRVGDSLFTPDGRLVSPVSLVLYLVDEAPGMLGQFQIIQDRTDHVTIRLTAEPEPSQELFRYQAAMVRRLFGERMHLSHEIVGAIPRESSGKYRFSVRNIAQGNHKS